MAIEPNWEGRAERMEEALREALHVLQQIPDRQRSKRHKCAIGKARAALSDSPAAEPVAGQGEAIARLRRQVEQANPNHKTMFVYVDDLRAALRPAPDVVVKPLEWEEIHQRRSDEDPNTEVVGFEANTSFDAWYHIETRAADFVLHRVDTERTSTVHETEREAKAAAQADYEARIRSALVEAPAAGMEAAVEALAERLEIDWDGDEPFIRSDSIEAALEAALPHLSASLSGERPAGHVEIAHDGFAGDIIGHYTTREEKRGVVVQQDGTRVVHVYGEKWLAASPRGQEGGEG